MRTLPYEDLVIPADRHRKVFTEQSLTDLADSIEGKGILHPPCLRDDGCTLLAGERRIRAMGILHKSTRPFTCEGEIVPAGHIPFTLAGELDPVELEEAELEENLLRESLTWQEEADAVSRLHALRTAQNLELGIKPTLQDFVSELSKTRTTSKTKVNNQLVLAKHLHNDEVSSAPDLKTALKIVSRAAEKRKNEILAQQFQNLDTKHKILHADCLTVMSKIDSHIDIIIADPPYGIGAHEFGAQADATHNYDDSEEAFWELMSSFLPLSDQVTKDSAHLYMFCDISMFYKLYADLHILTNWTPWSTPIIWNKRNGMLPRPEHGPRRCYEVLIYAIKGDRKVNSIFPDVIDVRSVARPVFGAEKPVELYENLISRSVRPNDIILDPFAGSGPLIPACDKFNCRALAIEQSKEKYNYILANRQGQSDE